MEWVYLEGTKRVLVAYREWKYCCRLLRHARKTQAPRHIRRFLKEDTLCEYDELIDAILCLTPKQSDYLLNTVHSSLLYDIVLLFSRT
jgi:hypothetical protein